MVLSRDDYMATLGRLVEGTDEASLQIIEDMTDTYNALEAQQNTDTDAIIAAAVAENDKKWAERYRARFFDSEGEGGTEEPTPDNITIDDLFEEGN